MIKLLDILKEIEVLDPNLIILPNENWIYKVNNENDWIRLAESLRKQGYTWNGGRKIELSWDYELATDEFSVPYYIKGYPNKIDYPKSIRRARRMEYYDKRKKHINFK